MTEDARGFRVALVAGELLNPPAGGLDALSVLQELDWGIIQLPLAEYPDEVAEPLLDQAAEHAEEFAKYGYTLAVVGGHRGLEAALDRYEVLMPRSVDPASAEELRDFLTSLH